MFNMHMGVRGQPKMGEGYKSSFEGPWHFHSQWYVAWQWCQRSHLVFQTLVE